MLHTADLFLYPAFTLLCMAWEIAYCKLWGLNELSLVQGFDEYMNLVLDDAEEVSVKRKTRKAVGELPALLERSHTSDSLRPEVTSALCNTPISCQCKTCDASLWQDVACQRVGSFNTAIPLCFYSVTFCFATNISCPTPHYYEKMRIEVSGVSDLQEEYSWKATISH